MEKIKLNYCCFANNTGYGFSALNNIQALENSGHYSIKLKIFGNIKPSKQAISDNLYSILMTMVKKEEDPNAITIYHCIPNMQRRIKNNKRSIGFATFETFDPPLNWIFTLEKNDAIITPSKFNYKIFAHSTIKKPIYYIPHCIDINLYNDKVLPLVNYDKFTFLFFGSWKKRKGYENLIESFIKEFDEKDNVQMLIKTDLPKKAEQYILDYKKEHKIKQGIAPIIIENKILDETVLPRFIKSAHCLIAPHAGEGFFIPGLQCMALKIPVIITNFSGCQDYANEKTAVLLEPSGFILKKEMDGIPQFRNKKWAFIEVSKIQQAMRYVVNNRRNMDEKINFAYNFVRENFNYTRISNLFDTMIQELYG